MTKQLHDMMSLTGRVALITGAAGHLGQVITGTLAELGASLLLVDRNKTALDALCKATQEKYQCAAHGIAIDLQGEDAIKKIQEVVQVKTNQVDVIINNAAYVGTSNLTGWVGSLNDQSVETWREAIEVNLTKPFALVKALSTFLQQSEAASIVNIGSIYGIVGPDFKLYDGLEMGNPAAYAASKGGLLQLTRWLACELAPNVRVNMISPGGIWRNQPEIFHRRYIKRTLLQRMAKEEDFKGAIAYLASDLSAYMTGQNIVIDGGWTVV